MIGCLFVLNILMALPVMDNQRQNQIHTLHPGDHVCVTSVGNGWLGTHWTTASGRKHGGWVWTDVNSAPAPKEPSEPSEPSSEG
jgi:hypothetical protein